MEQYLPYAPLILMVVVVLIQNRIFVTPEQLEKKHREIAKEVEDRFLSLQVFNEFKSNFNEMKDKVDKIYEHIMKN